MRRSNIVNEILAKVSERLLTEELLTDNDRIKKYLEGVIDKCEVLIFFIQSGGVKTDPDVFSKLIVDLLKYTQEGLDPEHVYLRGVHRGNLIHRSVRFQKREPELQLTQSSLEKLLKPLEAALNEDDLTSERRRDQLGDDLVNLQNYLLRTTLFTHVMPDQFK